MGAAKANWLDKTINVFAPKWGAQRQAWRTQREILSSYNGALPTRRSTLWSGSSQPQSVFGLQSAELRSMRDRSRELERNNPLADGLLSRAVENIVGTGFKVQVTTEDHEWNAKAESLLNKWYDSADITGLTWSEHQRLMVRSHLRDGDVGSILLSDGRLQPIEGDLICNPQKFDPKLNVINGVEVSDQNRPLRFYIDTVNAKGERSSNAVEAQDFAFYPRLKRTSQVRGEPALAQTFTLFDQIDGWVESSIVAARMAACFGIVWKKKNPAQWAGTLDAATNDAGVDQRQIDFSPGMVGVIGEGEEIQTLDPSQPQQSFPDMLAAFLRLTGLPLGMPLELVLLDFSRGPFSANRAAIQQAYRSFRTMQTLFADRYLSRIHRWRISKFINEKKLPARDDAWSHRIIAEPWPYLDPMRENLALQQRIDMGMENLSGALQAEGKDFDEMVAKRAKEIEVLDAAGIPLMHGSAMVPFDSVAPITNLAVGGNE